MTRKQLARFIKARRKSGFNSNLQFSLDAESCGFDVEQLGPPKAFIVDGLKGYQWSPVFDDGTTGILVEWGSYLFTPECNYHSARHFFAYEYKRAEFLPA